MAIFKKNSDVHTLIMEQIEDVEKVLLAFEGFMRAATTPETPKETLRALCKGVCEAENVADCSLRAMIDSLAEGSYLPSTREDLISIATSCDKVANKCETIAKIMVQQQILLPAAYGEDLTSIISITKTQFSVLEESISMMFAKFGALLADHSILDRVRSLETEIDVIEEKMQEALFASDKELAEKMQLTTLFVMFGDISDIIEDIADKIQIMLIARKA
jgi:predicted phosphate transport protein (TIGR00153 family)